MYLCIMKKTNDSCIRLQANAQQIANCKDAVSELEDSFLQAIRFA